MRVIASSHTLFSLSTSLITETVARLVCIASFPPRSTQLLPVFRARAAASIVTFGLASYIIPTQPRGTRTRSITRPFGLTVRSPLPMGDSSAATYLTASAAAFILSLPKRSLSSIARFVPFTSAASRSSRFAASILSALSSSASAIFVSRASRSPPERSTSELVAAFAFLADSFTYSNISLIQKTPYSLCCGSVISLSSSCQRQRTCRVRHPQAPSRAPSGLFP